MTRKERLNELWEDLLLFDESEVFFDTLYQKLLNEIEIETAANIKNNKYLKNLKLTKKRNADLYISMRDESPNKSAPQQFYEFLTNFRTDINGSRG